MRYFHGPSHWLNSAISDFLFIPFRDFLHLNVQWLLNHIKLAGLQHPLGPQWVPWLLIYRILWDFAMGFCIPDLLVLEMCILPPITGYVWHNDRETQCTLMFLYQNWEKDFHTSPGCALSWVDTHNLQVPASHVHVLLLVITYTFKEPHIIHDFVILFIAHIPESRKSSN